MLRITLLLILSISVFGFAPNAHVSRSSSVAVPVLKMATEEPVSEPEDEAESMVPKTSKFEAAQQTPKNLVRNVENAEPKWRDTEIAANSQFDIFNFSSIFVLVPGKRLR